MRNLISIIILIPFIATFSQELGEVVPDKPPKVFPTNALGFDLLIGESGFGFGGFYRLNLSTTFTLFADMSISEAKDEREFQYIDIFGNTFTIGKKNRVFQIPFNFGVHYRLFEKELTDNLRPYLNIGIGPTLVLTTPYAEEFFHAFSNTQLKVAAGGYVGFGANFGLDESSLLGLNFRYYLIKFLPGDEGVESLAGRFKNRIGGFYVSINFGFMY